MPLKPAYVSVTYGAGGSTRERTHDLVVKLQTENGFDHRLPFDHRRFWKRRSLQNPVPSIPKAAFIILWPCAETRQRDQTAWKSRQMGFSVRHGFSRLYKKKHFPHMGVGVAGFPEGHPATPNRLVEIEHLKEKIDAGQIIFAPKLFFRESGLLRFL